MLTYLGGVSIARALPLLSGSLDTVKAALAQQLADLAVDALSLKGDIASLEADAAGLLSELADVQGLADGILAQLAGGPQAVLRGIEAAIKTILDGSALMALQQAILGGPAVLLASLQAALAEVTGKIAAIQGRIAGIEARITGLLARAAALAARIEALKQLLAQLAQWQALIAAAGIHMWHFAGAVGDLPGELGGQIGDGPPGGGSRTDLANAIVLLTTATNPWAALSQVFKVTL
jgi:hypothetical protein